MALTSVFYDGPVTESDQARNLAGVPEYGVYGPDDFKVTAHPSIPFAVLVKAGRAHGCKVTDTAAEDQVVQCETLPSNGGVRWDLIAVHRDWQPLNGGPSELIALQAGSSPAIPPTRQNIPGDKDDQPLFLVKWQGGVSAPVDFIDLRCWAGNGSVIAKDDLALGYLARLGTRVKIGAKMWSRELDANGSEMWVNEDGEGPWMDLTAANGWAFVPGTGKCRRVARGALLQINMEATYRGTAGTPQPEWGVATLPAGTAPSITQLITGYTDNNRRPGNYWVTSAGTIKYSDGNTGNVVKLSGHVVR